MWRQEGIKGFFKGNLANLLRIFPRYCCEFFFYEAYKQVFFNKNTICWYHKLGCGGATGISACLLTYPMDIIRTKLSVDTAGVKDRRRLTIKSVSRDIY